MEETTLALPDETKFKADIQAINKFQQVVHANLIPEQDYGVIPGTSKPTLLKPGAEKITKLLGLCDHYVIIDRQEDWAKPFFRYLIQCQLVPVGNGDIVVSEGFGECNSMEGKYRYRWLFASELPQGFDKNQAIKRTVNTRSGKVPQFRIDNDDIYTQVNTLIKMAKKRALVDAALSAGRLSNIFTQDIEDIGELKVPPEPSQEKEMQESNDTKINIDLGWLKESLATIGWTNADAALWIKGHYTKAKGDTLKAMLGSLTKKQQEEFAKEIQSRLDRKQEGMQEGVGEENG
jgi:hypothetical protein